MHTFTYPQPQSRYRTFPSPQESLMLSFITWKGKYSDTFIVPFCYCAFGCAGESDLLPFIVESWNATLFLCWDSLWSVFKSAKHGNDQPSSPTCSQHPNLVGKFSSQFSSSSTRLTFPIHLCLEGSHSVLPTPAPKWKYFPALRRWEKNLTFLFFTFLSLKLRYSCLTMLCWLLLYNEVNQPYVYIHPLPLEPPSPPDPCHLVRVPGWAPCVIQQLRTGCGLHILVEICQSYCFNLSITPNPRPHVCSMCLCVCSVVSDSFATPWTVACQTSLSMGFSRSRLPFSTPGDFPNPGIEPGSPTLQADSCTTSATSTNLT